ncbi:MAG: hypothetical protein Q9207_006111 [Kuettlingeria erythrocarpa]
MKPCAQWYHVFTAPGEPEGIFTIRDNKQHLERRRQVNEFYTTGAISKIAYRLDDVSRLFLDKLAQMSATASSPFDMCQMMRFYAYDAMANLTFGQVFGFMENNSDVHGLIETLAAFIRYGMVVGGFVEWHPLIIRVLQTLTPGGNKGLLHLKSIGEQAIKKMDEDLESLANEKAGLDRSDQKAHSFVGVMQERHQRDPSTFSRDDVAYHMLPNVVAGADTTSASLNAVVYYLWTNPRVLARLREELDEWAATSTETRVAEKRISMTEAQGLPYFQAVLKETMRIFPGLGNNLTVVGMNAYVAHANRDVFGPDADEFRPERWLGDQETVTQMDQYFLFFGRGPRNCVGRNIALFMLNTLIPELVLRFDLKPTNPDEKWTVHNDAFMYQENFHVKVRDRKLAE